MLQHWYITKTIKAMVAPILLIGKTQNLFWVNLEEMIQNTTA